MIGAAMHQRALKDAITAGYAFSTCRCFRSLGSRFGAKKVFICNSDAVRDREKRNEVFCSVPEDRAETHTAISIKTKKDNLLFE